MGTLSALTARGVRSGRAAADYVEAMDTWQDEVERQYDAFLLDPGMGPMTYLTADGRVLFDMRGWDGDSVVEATTAYEVNAALIVGAKKTGIVELLDLIPKAPPGSRTCPRCDGTRMAPLAPQAPPPEFPCRQCDARGWV